MMAEPGFALVILGGDHPLGLDLIIQLEKSGYIVLVSASTLEAADAIEKKTNGYVRALVLDPSRVRISSSHIPSCIELIRVL